MMVRDKQSADYVKSLLSNLDVAEIIDVAFFMPYEKKEFNKEYIHVGLNISALLWNGGYTMDNQFGLKSNYQCLIRGIVEYFLSKKDVKLHLIPHVVGGEHGTPQLDDASRGFSYMQDAPLDMRMDTSAPLSAADIVNTWSQEELRRILFEYGEERYAPAIARAIVRARETAPVKTTLELVEIIKSAMPPAALREKQHPAKRSFQAIRIAVNGELDALPPMLRAAVDGLNPGGRLAVITFHSLEDRIVKRTLAELARGCVCPPEFPVCVCGKKPQVRLVTRKPVTAGGAELEENPRARSAKLRVAEKCGFDL